MRSFENHGWRLSARKISSNVQNPIFRRETQITPNLPNISRRHNIPTRTQHYLIITSPKQPIHNTIIIISNPLNRHVTTSKLTSVETPNPPETPSARYPPPSKETDSTRRPYRPKITDRAKDIYGHRYLKLLWLGKFKPILGATGALRLAIQAARCIHTNAPPSYASMHVHRRIRCTCVRACIHACARRVTRRREPICLIHSPVPRVMDVTQSHVTDEPTWMRERRGESEKLEVFQNFPNPKHISDELCLLLA